MVLAHFGRRTERQATGSGVMVRYGSFDFIAGYMKEKENISRRTTDKGIQVK